MSAAFAFLVVCVCGWVLSSRRLCTKWLNAPTRKRQSPSAKDRHDDAAQRSVTPRSHVVARGSASYYSQSSPRDGMQITDSGPAARYLTYIGLAAILEDLPKLRERAGRYPAIVADLVDVAGQFRGRHYTYLADDSKRFAPARPQRRLERRGPGDALAGTAIRLYEANDRVAVALGLELALAVRLRSKWPVWSAPSPPLLADMDLPRTIREVRIYAPGLQFAAASELRRRLEAQKRTVEIIAVGSVAENDPRAAVAAVMS
jgi:hypothetical protein